MQIPFSIDESYRNLRRAAVSAHSTLVGIDFVEVTGPAVLWMNFIPSTVAGKQFIPAINGSHIRITHISGALPYPLRVVSVEPAETADATWLVVALAEPGEPAPPVDPDGEYLLEIVDAAGFHFDPLFTQATFSFGAGNPTDIDPLTMATLPAASPPAPEIDYLAKDYASFRQLMLDRLAVLMPNWAERHTADLGITLVELLAYAADHLSYYQDAVATEAYLGTARRRVSVRRHARLADYAMHEGCNARVWVQLQVTADTLLTKGTQIFTRIPGQPARIAPGSAAYDRCLAAQPEVFETFDEVRLKLAHNAIPFHRWGATSAALPAGATQATLSGDNATLQLKPGDVLILQGAVGSGEQPRCHAVRLTEVTASEDALGDLTNPSSAPVPVVEIAWDSGDALPFALPLAPGSSVAYGNVVLADNGRTIQGEPIARPDPRARRYRPVLQLPGLTFAAPIIPFNGPARAALELDPRAALPTVTVAEAGTDPAADTLWQPHATLLDSDSFARAFVVELENDGSATLRFGDGVHGQQPSADRALLATYRVGGGQRGNVGPGALAHIVTKDTAVSAVRNLLPAQGGVDPEPIDQVRLYAQAAFRTQERCVTAADYQALAERQPDVRRAAAELRWTGSWYTAVIAVQRQSGRAYDPSFGEALRATLDRYRMIGHDVEVQPPDYVPLDIALTIYVAPDAFRGTVTQALREAFSRLDLSDGRRGFFHPENFTFGQPVYMSHVIAAAVAIPGVDRADVDRFQRWGQTGRGEYAAGRIPIGPLEIARLDASPVAPQLGMISFSLVGGR